MDIPCSNPALGTAMATPWALSMEWGELKSRTIIMKQVGKLRFWLVMGWLWTWPCRSCRQRPGGLSPSFPHEQNPVGSWEPQCPPTVCRFYLLGQWWVKRVGNGPGKIREDSSPPSKCHVKLFEIVHMKWSPLHKEDMLKILPAAIIFGLRNVSFCFVNSLPSSCYV